MQFGRVRDLPAPIVTALLLTLVVVAVTTWYHGLGDEDAGPPMARVTRTRAKLFDGQVIFTADIELSGRWGSFAFARHYLDVRDAMVDVLHTKSRYMVNSTLAREALRRQMLDAVNRVIGDGLATRLHFREFLFL
jgi:flagellar basal body-associated protein FliL